MTVGPPPCFRWYCLSPYKQSAASIKLRIGNILPFVLSHRSCRSTACSARIAPRLRTYRVDHASIPPLSSVHLEWIELKKLIGQLIAIINDPDYPKGVKYLSDISLFPGGTCASASRS